MATLKEDIKKASAWTVTAFKALGKNLDYSIESLKLIDDVIDEQTQGGKPKSDGLLADGLGGKLFSFGSYIGETIIKNVKGSEWITNDKDPQGEITIQVKFSNGWAIWPVQRVMKRLKNGSEDGIYVYGKVAVEEWSKGKEPNEKSDNKPALDNNKNSWLQFWKK